VGEIGALRLGGELLHDGMNGHGQLSWSKNLNP
jgi:hypothetical protein